MVSVDDYTCEADCVYKEEHYSVRNNGAVMRHAREGKRMRKDDGVWTFGKPNDRTGYMEIAGQRVHRIVAFAFHGEPPTKEYVVDHIDTNRRNNRPENLRWVTRLENALNNPITRARIENICGSIENFLADPSILRGHEHIDNNFGWMRTVSSEEARASLQRLTEWAKDPPKPQGGAIGEWIYKEVKPYSATTGMSTLYRGSTKNLEETFHEEQVEPPVEPNKDDSIPSLTPNAVQIDWRTPSEFPFCPQAATDKPLAEYASRLKRGEPFCRNEIYSSIIDDFALTDGGNALWVKTHGEGIKPWALARVVYKDVVYMHYNEGSFFKEDGATKYFTLAQGLEWTGGEVFDDYC